MHYRFGRITQPGNFRDREYSPQLMPERANVHHSLTRSHARRHRSLADSLGAGLGAGAGVGGGWRVRMRRR